MESFSTCFWNENNNDFSGFEVLCRKLKAGKHMWIEYIEFLRHRALKVAWGELSARTELVGLDNISLASDLTKAADSLNEKLEIDQRKRKHAQAEVLKLQNNRKSAIKKVTELKRNYFNKSKHSEQIGQALLAEMGKSNIHPKEIDKLKMRHNKSTDGVNEAEMTYKDSLAMLEDLRLQWEKETHSACQLFEDLENHRTKCLRDSFWEISNLFSAYLTKEDDNQEEIRKILERLNLEGDIKLFIKENQTGKKKPKPVIYEPYRSDNYQPITEPEKEEPIYAVVNKNEKTKKYPQTEPVEEIKETAQSTPIIQINSEEIKEAINSTQSPTTPLVENEIYESADTFEEFVWRVIDSYISQSTFEISLPRDEYVQVINQTNREWWQIKTHDGRSGYFPSNNLEYGAHIDIV